MADTACFCDGAETYREAARIWHRRVRGRQTAAVRRHIGRVLRLWERSVARRRVPRAPNQAPLFGRAAWECNYCCPDNRRLDANAIPGGAVGAHFDRWVEWFYDELGW